MEEITIDVGVYTALQVDLTGYDFTGVEKLVFTIKNAANVALPVIVEREFSTPKVHQINITPEESISLYSSAVYDFTKVLLDGKCYKETTNGKIVLRKGVGECIE